MNSFCINKKVISTKVEFFKDEKNAYWTIFIENETVLMKTAMNVSLVYWLNAGKTEIKIIKSYNYYSQ